MFWWSAVRIFIGAPFIEPRKSSTAMRAASIEERPPNPAQVPDWSLRMPIFTIPSERAGPCAAAGWRAPSPAHVRAG